MGTKEKEATKANHGNNIRNIQGATSEKLLARARIFPLSKALCFKTIKLQLIVEKYLKVGGCALIYKLSTHNEFITIEMNDKNEKATITDRLALGFGGGLVTFITATFLWLLVHLFFAKAALGFGSVLPFYLVWLFSIAGFILGFATLEIHLLRIISPIWVFIHKLVTKYIVLLFN